MLSQNRNINKHVTVGFTNENNQLGKSLIFVGAKAKSIIGKAKNNDVVVTKFLHNAIKAYAKCTRYMALKRLFHNMFLKYVVSGIDPVVIHAKSETTLRYLLELPKHISNILQDSDIFEENVAKSFLMLIYKLVLPIITHKGRSLVALHAKGLLGPFRIYVSIAYDAPWSSSREQLSYDG